MLANVSRDLLLYLLIFLFILAVLVVVGGTIWTIIMVRKTKEPAQRNRMILAFVFVVIAAISWLMNFGWIRFALTLMMAPFIHAIVFFITNIFAVTFINRSKTMNVLNMLFIITYLVSYVFLPDGGDVGGAYFFFGQINHDALIIVAEGISSLAFLGHVVLFVWQFIEMIRLGIKGRSTQHEKQDVLSDSDADV